MFKSTAVKIFIAVIALIVVIGSVIYFGNGNKYKGFLLARNKQPIEKAVEDVPWWCISEKEWEEKWANNNIPETAEQEPESSDVGTVDIGEVPQGTPEEENEEEEGENEESEETEGDEDNTSGDEDESENNDGDENNSEDRDTSTDENKTGTHGGLTPGQIAAFPDFNFQLLKPGRFDPTIGEEEKKVEDKKEEPEESKDEELLMGFSCDCNQKEFFIEELDKSFECPDDYGEVKEYRGKGYHLWGYGPQEYWCEEKWQCPKGYKFDWEKIYDQCEELKQGLCENSPHATSATRLSEACGVLADWLWDMPCPDKAKCDQIKELEKQFASQPNSEELTKALIGAGLASESTGPSDTYWQCKTLYD